MKTWKNLGSSLTLVAALGLGGGILIGCEEEGPGEELGEAIDNAGDNMQNAAENAGERMEEAGERVEDKAD